MSEYLKQFAADCKKKYESHCKQEVLDRVAECRFISIEEYESLCEKCGGFNSYDRHLLYPLMDDELLIKTIKYCLLNCSPDKRIPSPTYDDAVLNVLAPLLVERRESIGGF